MNCATSSIKNTYLFISIFLVGCFSSSNSLGEISCQGMEKINFRDSIAVELFFQKTKNVSLDIISQDGKTICYAENDKELVEKYVWDVIKELYPANQAIIYSDIILKIFTDLLSENLIEHSIQKRDGISIVRWD